MLVVIRPRYKNAGKYYYRSRDAVCTIYMMSCKIIQGLTLQELFWITSYFEVTHSSDLNSIEHRRDIMVRKMNLASFTSQNELAKNSLTSSPRRMQTSIRARGGNLQYLESFFCKFYIVALKLGEFLKIFSFCI